MRIAIDYTPAIRQRAGIARYVRNLVDAMLAQDATNNYSLLASGRPTEAHPFPIAENVRARRIFIPERYLKILWHRWRLPLYATYFSGPVDIYHSLDFALPPLNGNLRKVVTIYELSFLEHPEHSPPGLITYLNKVVPEAVASADVVATISQASRRALIDQLKTPPEKISVIPCGVGAHFRRITDPVTLTATRHKFGLRHPLVLNVGTLDPRRNHLGLIKAFYQAQQKKKGPAMLALVGGKGWLYEEAQQLVTDLRLEDKVRFLGHVSDLELITLYSMADVFASPSFSEGFGIPPLEAMACGAPVITSNTASLPEVVGDAGLLIDPYDINALAQAMTCLVENEALQEELRQKGYQQAQHYTWSAAASKMLSVYQKLHAGATNFSDEMILT